MANEWIAPTYNELLKSIDVGNYADKLYMNYLSVEVPLDDWAKCNKIYVQGHKVSIDFKSPAMSLYYSSKKRQYRFEYKLNLNGKVLVSTQYVSRELLDNLTDVDDLPAFLGGVKQSLVSYMHDYLVKDMEYVISADISADVSKSAVGGYVYSPNEKASKSIFGTGHQTLQPSVKKVLPSGEKSIYEVSVDCPACSSQNEVYYMIQHLNDVHTWDRKTQIADWLDTLHDAGIIDITITSPDPDKA